MHGNTPRRGKMFGVPIFVGKLRDEGALCGAVRSEPQRLHRKAVAKLRVRGIAEAPGQLVVDEVTNQIGIVPVGRGRLYDIAVDGSGERRIERVRHLAPPAAYSGGISVYVDRDDMGHLAAFEQARLTPVANRVEAPGAQPLDRRPAPKRQIIRSVFALQIGGVKIETPPVVELPAPLFGQPAALIRRAVMRGQRTPRIRKLGEHGFPSLDKSRPDIRTDDIDAEREKAVAIGRDQPPPPLPLLCTKEPGRAKNGTLE